eukprot:SAG31_NODE_3808_length_3863_cov_4.036663_4_plen_55_part_00
MGWKASVERYGIATYIFRKEKPYVHQAQTDTAEGKLIARDRSVHAITYRCSVAK